MLNIPFKKKGAEPEKANEDQPEMKKIEKERPCKNCGFKISAATAKDNFYICPNCGGYFSVSAPQRLEMILDKGTFEEWDKEMPVTDPLNFPDYEEKLEEAKEKTHLNEAVVTGRGRICGCDTVIGVCDSRYFMGSMGHNMGEKITLAFEKATRLELPVILYAASGGARMQEGLISLMQMAKTSAAVKRHSEAGLLFISFLTNPTTGGVTASFAMLGDIILAEPDALIGFAGPRVIEQTIRQKLPDGFQKAEFQQEHGFVDMIVERQDQRQILGTILKMHSKENSWQKWSLNSDGSKLPDISDMQTEAGKSPVGKPAKSRKAPFSGIMKQCTLDNISLRRQDPWDVVRDSRKTGRPTAMSYIETLFEDFEEFHGDRCYGDDSSIVGGIASFCGMPVTVIGQERGRGTDDIVRRNFGMPSPEGYRKALRLMEQAEKFSRPIICFVDTPGAYPGKEAEERGQGEAIARNLYEMSDFKVPLLSIVIGQGGSGGALALAVSNEVWMLENATYSILSPEGFASILWKDSEKADEAARAMKMTAEELYQLGLIERIIAEDKPAAEENLKEIRDNIAEHMKDFFESCAKMTPEEIVAQRYERFRRF